MQEFEECMVTGLLALMRRWVRDGMPDGKEGPGAKALDGTVPDPKEKDALRRAS